MSKVRVLVMDGEQRAALAIVRSLGRAGFMPYVCSSRGRSLAGASRFAAGEAAIPAPLDAPDSAAAGVEALVRRWSIDVLMPVSEAALFAVLESRESLRHVLIPFPDVQTFRRINDKRCLMEVGREIGIEVPAQAVVEDPTQLGGLPATLLEGPVVIKPFRSVVEADGRRYKLGVDYATGSGQLRDRISSLPPAAFPVLVQQRVVGPGVGVFLLVWDGETRAVFSHRRIREKPPSGGVSVYRESIAADPELVARSEALLEAFAWQGVAMVEYKVDASTGTPYLMEVNGRFWGSLQLAIDAGVDFPTLLLRSALNGEVPGAIPAYRVGVRSRWWWGDVDQLLMRLRRSAEDLDLPPDAASRTRALRDFLTLWRPGDRSEVFRWSDPGPFVRESIDWFARH